MAHEEAEYVTPRENGHTPDDDAEILRGLEQRVAAILNGIRETRRGIARLAAAERAGAIRELARITGEHGDAQHVVRQALEALARQLAGPNATTYRELPAVRRRSPRLTLGWWHAAFGAPGLGMLTAGIIIHDVTRATGLIAAGTSLLVAVLGNSFHKRSG